LAIVEHRDPTGVVTSVPVSEVLSPKIRRFPSPNSSNMSVDKPWGTNLTQDNSPVDFAKIMKILSSKETRKHSINLTERLMNDSIIGFGVKERKVFEGGNKTIATRKQVYSNLTRTMVKSNLDRSYEDPGPIMQGMSSYHELVKENKIPLN
jgi:hypothetical protein